MMSEYKRLHPIAALWNVIKRLKEMIFPLLFFVFVGRGKSASFWGYFPFIIMGASILYILVSGIIKWKRFSYRLEDGELRIEHGLFVKKKRYIPFDRIQSLNFSEGILHRPFGLVRVQVETAGSSEKHKAEAELTAISKKDALWLEKTIQRSKYSLVEEGDSREATQEDPHTYKVSSFELFIMASTSGGIGVVLSAIIAFLTQFEDVIPYQKLFDEMGRAVHNSVFLAALSVFFGLFAAWLFSIVITMLKYGNFTVKRTKDELVITRGLIEKKQITIPIKRIQALRIAENIFRQPFGLATVYIESAGGSIKEADSATVMVLPIVKRKRIPQLAARLLEEYDLELDFSRPPIRSLGRYAIKEALPAVIIGGVLTCVFWPWGSLSILLMIFAALLGFLKFKTAGWCIRGNQLSLQYRSIVKTTLLMKKKRIQSIEINRSWFQERKKLASISATIKSGEMGRRGTVRYLDIEDAQRIYQWFHPGKANKYKLPQ